jgi:hypothetical protein
MCHVIHPFKVSKSTAFDILIKSYIHHHQIPEHFHLPRKKSIPISCHTHLLTLPLSLWQPLVYFIFHRFTYFKYISYKPSHTMWPFAFGFFFFFFGLFIHLFICAYIVWAIFPPCSPAPSFSPYPPHFQAEPVLHSSPILLKSRHKQ